MILKQTVDEAADEIEALREHVEALRLVATAHEPEIERLREQLRAVLGHVADLRAQLEKANTPLWDKP